MIKNGSVSDVTALSIKEKLIGNTTLEETLLLNKKRCGVILLCRLISGL